MTRVAEAGTTEASAQPGSASLQHCVELAARRSGAVHHRDPGHHQQHESRDQQPDFVLWRHLAHAETLTPPAAGVTAGRRNTFSERA